MSYCLLIKMPNQVIQHRIDYFRRRSLDQFPLSEAPRSVLPHTALSVNRYKYLVEQKLRKWLAKNSLFYLFLRELGSLMCLRMTLSEHRASIYSMIRTACQPDQIASLYHAFHMWCIPTGTKELVKPNYTRPIRRRHKLYQPYSY